MKGIKTLIYLKKLALIKSRKVKIFSFSKKILCMLLFLVVASCATTSKKILKPPVIIPVSLEKSGVIENFEMKISVNLIYDYFLRFSYTSGDQIDREKVRKLLGGNEKDSNGNLIELGVPTPIKLKIYKIDNGLETPIYTKEVDPTLTSWGGDSFDKSIGVCDLTTGLYRVHLESIRASPEFSGVPIFFVVGYDKYKTTFNPKK